MLRVFGSSSLYTCLCQWSMSICTRDLVDGFGAAIFASYWGFFICLGGCYGGSALPSGLANLGREFATSVIGDRLKKYWWCDERNGFAAVLYCGWYISPSRPWTSGWDWRKLRFLDYFFGTALGIVVGTFILLFSSEPERSLGQRKLGEFNLL